MAQLWSTGPAQIYAGVAGSQPTSAVFVGTCETRPTFDIDNTFSPVNNDAAGDEPMDEMLGGQRGMGTFNFGRFNYNIAEALAHHNPSAALALAIGGAQITSGGITGPGDIGSLMLTEGRAVIIYILFPYYLKAAMGAGAPAGMVPGYRFPGTMISRHSPKVGTQPHSKMMIFNFRRLPSVGASNAYGNLYETLFDFNVTGLPAAN